MPSSIVSNFFGVFEFYLVMKTPSPNPDLATKT